VAIVPTHSIVLVAALTGHHVQDLTLALGLADVRALNDDPVTGLGMHGRTSSPARLTSSTHTALGAATEPPQRLAVAVAANVSAGATA
jgi:hypothetical protein